MHWNDICKPLVLVAGKVLARVFLNHLTDCITKVFIQTVFFLSGIRNVEKTMLCIMRQVQ